MVIPQKKGVAPTLMHTAEFFLVVPMWKEMHFPTTTTGKKIGKNGILKGGAFPTLVMIFLVYID